MGVSVTLVRLDWLQGWLQKTAVQVEVERELEHPKSSVDMQITSSLEVHSRAVIGNNTCCFGSSLVFALHDEENCILIFRMSSPCTQALFLNSAVDAMDPLVEQWPLAMRWFRSKDGVARLVVQSQDMLNINITPSAFRCAWQSHWLTCLHNVSISVYFANCKGKKALLATLLERALWCH